MLNACGLSASLKAVLFLLVTTGGVDLEIPGGDQRVNVQQDISAAINRVQLEQVLVGARLGMVFGVTNEGDQGGREAVPFNPGDRPDAGEVNRVHIHLGRFGGYSTAVDNHDVKALEMQPINMIDHIPISTAGGSRAAPGVDDATEAVVGLTFGFGNGAAAGEPATTGARRWRAANGAAQAKVNTSVSVATIHGKLLATAHRGSGWQAGRVHTDGVSSRTGQVQKVASIAIGGSRANTLDTNDNTTLAIAVRATNHPGNGRAACGTSGQCGGPRDR